MNDMPPVTGRLKDWETDQEARGCPRCGDHAILQAVQRGRSEIGVGPASPCAIALGSGGGFIARVYPVSKDLSAVLKAAHEHPRMAFGENFENCIVNSKDVLLDFTEKANANTRQLWLAGGAPMMFNKGTQGIALDTEVLSLRIMDVADGPWQSAGVGVRDDRRRTVRAGVADERACAPADKSGNLAKLLRARARPGLWSNTAHAGRWAHSTACAIAPLS